MSKKLVNQIVKSLPFILFSKYFSTTQTHIIIKGLGEEFDASIFINKTQLECKLFNMKCTDPRKIHVHLTKLEDYCTQLVELKVMYDRCCFINIIFTSVPQAYQATITAIQEANEAVNARKGPANQHKLYTQHIMT